MASDKEFTKKVKGAFDLVAFVSESVALKRAGKYFQGLSPFTKEKSPSFFVDPERQSFHCYSSENGGDIFDFVMLTKGFSFREALEFLAKKAEIPMEKSNRSPEEVAQDKKLEEEKKLSLKLNRYAARFYQEQLEGGAGASARDYVDKRGITRDMQLAFAMGFAPDGWTNLRDYFIKIKAPLLKAYELGLFRTKGGEKPKEDGSNLFDTFRNRLIFPIRDTNGEVLGFGGRWLGSSTAEAPKYLNSPESIVYEKEKVLYNIDQARKPIRDMESVVLVEGYMDCISMVQAGFPNVVANCGTALTRTQAALLKKLASKVICLYDSDAAGQAASERAMNLFLEAEGFPLLGARVDAGKDPDEFLRSQGEMGQLKMAEILQNAPALIDEWIQKQFHETSTSLQGRAESLDRISQKLAKLRDDLWIEARISWISKALEMDAGVLVGAIRKYRKGFSSSSSTNVQAKIGPKPTENRPSPANKVEGKSKQNQRSNGKREIGFEQRFLAELIKHPKWISLLRMKHEENPQAVLPLIGEVNVQRVLSAMLVPLVEEEKDEDRLQEIFEQTREKPELRSFLSAIFLKGEEGMHASEDDLEAALARLKNDFLKRKTAELNEKIRQSQAEGKSEESARYFQELMDLELTRKKK
jgi:DNA primase